MATRFDKRDPAKERFWRGIVERFQGSNKSVKAFCADERITESQFYSWRRELKRRDQVEKGKAPVNVASFVPIQIRNTPDTHGTTEGDFELRTPSGTISRMTTNVAQEVGQFILKLLVQKQC